MERMESAAGPQARSNQQMMRVGAVVAGALAAAALVYFGFHWLMTPGMPDVSRARAGEVAAYLAHPRGLHERSQAKRQAFLDSLVQHYRSKEQRQELAAALEELSPAERDVVRDAIFETMKAKILADAKEFQRARDKAAQQRILEANVEPYDSLRRWLAGGKGMPNLTASMSSGLEDQQGLTQYLFTHTTDAERELAEPYVVELAKAATVRKLRTALSQPAGKPG